MDVPEQRAANIEGHACAEVRHEIALQEKSDHDDERDENDDSGDDGNSAVVIAWEQIVENHSIGEVRMKHIQETREGENENETDDISGVGLYIVKDIEELLHSVYTPKSVSLRIFSHTSSIRESPRSVTMTASAPIPA